MTTAIEAAQKRAAELRASGELERLDPIEKARRNPNSRQLAIRAKCWECVGGENARATIRECASKSCPLWPHRPYQQKDAED